MNFYYIHVSCSADQNDACFAEIEFGLMQIILV